LEQLQSHEDNNGAVISGYTIEEIQTLVHESVENRIILILFAVFVRLVSVHSLLLHNDVLLLSGYLAIIQSIC
jgi:hypothetical protein